MERILQVNGRSIPAHSSNAYYGQGNHNLTVGDLDGDGFNEIQFEVWL